MPVQPKKAALAAAAGKYKGVLSGALNQIDDASQRNRDVAARRTADNAKYNAYVLGKQGALAQAGQSADDKALAQSLAVQAATNSFTGGVGKGLQSQRAAQGVSGPVPWQQLAAPAGQAVKSQQQLGAGSQQLADRANTNRGKAGFLAAAAQATMAANERGIAGDAYKNESELRREKVGLLSQRDAILAQQKAAEEAARAEIVKAQIAAQESAADRASRENIAYSGDQTQLAGYQSTADSAAADRALRYDQGSKNRQSANARARLSSKSKGGVSQSEQRRRATALSSLRDSRAEAQDTARYLVKQGVTTPSEMRAALTRQKFPKVSVDYAVAAAFGRKAGTPKAATNYYALENAIKSGKR